MKVSLAYLTGAGMDVMLFLQIKRKTGNYSKSVKCSPHSTPFAWMIKRKLFCCVFSCLIFAKYMYAVNSNQNREKNALKVSSMIVYQE